MKLRAPEETVVKPFHANVGVRAWYYAQLDKLLTAMTRDAVQTIGETYAEAPPTFGFAQDAKKRRSPAATAAAVHVVKRTAAARTPKLLQQALAKWGGVWTSRFDKLSVDVATIFANKAKKTAEMQMRAAFRKAGFTVKFKPTSNSVAAYESVIAENVGLIKSIPSQYLTDVQSSVWNSVMVGGDLDTLSRTIMKKYGIARKRAALIARDQNNKAKAVIENVRRMDLGLEEAIWQHSGGGKVPRPSHLKAGQDHVRYKLAKGWYDPDEGKWIWPGVLINCRCTSSVVVPGYNG